MASILDREHIVAGPNFNRWLVPPAALCVHLCIGEAYAFSVFNAPLTRVIGITKSAPGDWKLTELGWIFSLAIVFLGLSAAFTGTWLDRVGPRKAMVTAAVCFCGGFFISAIGVSSHNLWLIYLGYGVLGGCGLGIGYISPVKTLIMWFPDRPGMATGMAIMGFGGGAFIAAPLSVMLMRAFSGPHSVGVAGTFVALGLIYAVFMLVGSAIVRVPMQGWQPAGFVPPAESRGMITTETVHVDQALKTPQFYLLWWVLCLNVTAGIGVLGQASVMAQEMFHGRITPVAAAGFVGLLSLFNMGGRFFWASCSDYIGRKNTYFVFFVLGIVLYIAVPSTARAGSVALFVLAYGIILSMYGGGFSTIPAYLKDVFGVQYVGAIHGRILTAWSAAGIFGPVLVNYIRAYQISHGVPKADAYTVTMYIMAGLLFIGLLCNLGMRPVHVKHHLALQDAEA
ncbi:MAG TPA: OFA family MFS transporter [Acetobacteraceae bacterium]|jgi:MFS family permease|nr:OFA family MFS transporter [Acetobacteraceae bacterium]